MVKILRSPRKWMLLFCEYCRGYTNHRRAGIAGEWICSFCGNRVAQ